jgi:hypothetical protein
MGAFKTKRGRDGPEFCRGAPREGGDRHQVGRWALEIGPGGAHRACEEARAAVGGHTGAACGRPLAAR